MRWWLPALLLVALSAAPAYGYPECGVYVGGESERPVGTVGPGTPAAVGAEDAVIAGCGTDSFVPDRRGVVQRMAGVPPLVGVRLGRYVYAGEGQMVALAGHPLHAVASPVRRGARCVDGPTLRATADAAGVPTTRRARVFIDARTVLVNRPVTTPLVHGQRVRVTTSACRRGLFADRLAFVGRTTVAPARHTPVFAAPEPVLHRSWVPWVPVAVWVFVLGGLAVRRPALSVTWAGFATVVLAVAEGIALVVRHRD